MATVAIVGAGQSGLQLGIGLLADGHEVTLVSNRTAENLWHGKVMSSQFMFASALDTERALGIDFWADVCPQTEGVQFAVPHPEIRGEKALYFASRLDRPGQSVDQRVKYPRWLEHFESKGGSLVIHEATSVAFGLDQLCDSDGHPRSFSATKTQFRRDAVNGPSKA